MLRSEVSNQLAAFGFWLFSFWLSAFSQTPDHKGREEHREKKFEFPLCFVPFVAKLL
jgi:hypothetical protein